MAIRFPARLGIIDIRGKAVGHPFGSIKQRINQGAAGFPTRSLEKVRAEFSLTALASNLGRPIDLVGVPGLIRPGWTDLTPPRQRVGFKTVVSLQSV